MRGFPQTFWKYIPRERERERKRGRWKIYIYIYNVKRFFRIREISTAIDARNAQEDRFTSNINVFFSFSAKNARRYLSPFLFQVVEWKIAASISGIFHADKLTYIFMAEYSAQANAAYSAMAI